MSYTGMVVNEVGEPLGVETLYDDEPDYYDDDDYDVMDDGPDEYVQDGFPYETDLTNEWDAS